MTAILIFLGHLDILRKHHELLFEIRGRVAEVFDSLPSLHFSKLLLNNIQSLLEGNLKLLYHIRYYYGWSQLQLVIWIVLQYQNLFFALNSVLRLSRVVVQRDSIFDEMDANLKFVQEVIPFVSFNGHLQVIELFFELPFLILPRL